MTNWLDEIEQRAAKATEGPWNWQINQDDETGTVITAKNNHNENYGHGPFGSTNLLTTIGSSAVLAHHEDAAFIAHSREDIPRLVKRVRELEEFVKTVHHYLAPDTPCSAWTETCTDEVVDCDDCMEKKARALLKGGEDE